jgi:hypothetical protein
MRFVARLLLGRSARLLVAVTVFAAGAWIAAGLRSPAARGDTAFGFEGTASAGGIQVFAKAAQDPVQNQYEASSPTVSALVNSEPDSQAFAANPYPGKDVLSLAASLPTGPLPAPEVVTSGSPGTPKQEMSQPGYTISAESTQTSSHGHGETGASSGDTASVGSVAADAQVTATASSVTSTATSSAHAFAAGPLAIAGVLTKAVATLDSSGRTTLRSSIAAGDVTVNGTRVGLGPDGLEIAGTTVPLPDASPVTTALEQAGITVTYVKETKTPTGVTAPAVLIHVTDPGGQSDTPYVLGQASAGVAPQASFDTGTGDTIDTGTGTTGTTGGSSTSGSSTASGGAPAVLPGGQSTSTAPAGGSSPAVAGPDSGRSLVPAASSADTIAGGGLFYFVLVIAAAAALGTGQLMRLLGVRWARSSG